MLHQEAQYKIDFGPGYRIYFGLEIIKILQTNERVKLRVEAHKAAA